MDSSAKILAKRYAKAYMGLDGKRIPRSWRPQSRPSWKACGWFPRRYTCNTDPSAVNTA